MTDRPLLYDYWDDEAKAEWDMYNDPKNVQAMKDMGDMLCGRTSPSADTERTAIERAIHTADFSRSPGLKDRMVRSMQAPADPRQVDWVIVALYIVTALFMAVVFSI